MNPRRTSRARTLPVAALAAASLVVAALMVAAPAAQAAPVFVDAQTDFDAEVFAHDDSACVESLQLEPADVTGPLVENGPPVGLSGSASVTATAADPTDVMTIQTTGSSSTSISSSAGNPRTIDATAQATLTATSTKPVSACDVHAGADVEGEFEFTVAQAGFLTVHIVRKGLASTDFSLEQNIPDLGGNEDEDGEALDIDQSTRIFLVPGTYQGEFSVVAEYIGHTARPTSTGSASLHATFAVAGTQSVAAAGKGKGYLTMPSARSCATHNLTPTVTGKKKSAEKIKQISFFLNDAKVATVKHPKKGAVLSVPVADGTDAELRAVVQLLPKKKGKPGKEQEVSASYVACTS